MKKSYIFDLDGTLWDTAEQVSFVWEETVKKYGIEIDKNKIKSIMGLTKNEIVSFLFGNDLELGYKYISECQERENEYLKENGGNIYKNTLKTLEQLNEQGIDLYIVSNCQTGYLEAFLKYYNIQDLFKDYECAGRTGKKKEENIKILMQRNNINEEDAVYIGDTEIDYMSAMNNNIDFIWAEYGFGKCDNTTKKISDICELIK